MSHVIPEFMNCNKCMSRRHKSQFTALMLRQEQSPICLECRDLIQLYGLNQTKKVMRECLKCGKQFKALGKYNRLCELHSNKDY